MGNSAVRCETHCAVGDYRYFGLQDHSQCFCGNEMNSFTEKPESECNYECPGNTYEKCGSAWRNSLYQRKTNATSYVGCYLDTADRQLNGTYANWLPHNNPQKCEDYCAIDNYKYFALQNAHQCFCGYVLNS